MSRRGRPMRELPGWRTATAVVEDHMGKALGNEFRIIGALVSPGGINHVSPALLHGMVLGLVRHDEQRWIREELADGPVGPQRGRKVISMYQYLQQKRRLGDWAGHVYANDGLGNWDGHWSSCRGREEAPPAVNPEGVGVTS